jgi:hypothetical protein
VPPTRRLLPRRVAAVTLVLGAVASLTACTPGRQPLLAITLVNGLPVALLHGCMAGPVEFSVTENTQATPTATPSGTSSTPTPVVTTLSPTNTITPESETYVFTWAVRKDDATPTADVQLFSAPAGWTVEKQTLTALQKGSRYIADAKMPGVFDVSPVNFTLDELLGLQPDQVIYGINAPLTTVLSRADFDKKAEESCAASNPSPTG